MVEEAVVAAATVVVAVATVVAAAGAVAVTLAEVAAVAAGVVAHPVETWPCVSACLPAAVLHSVLAWIFFVCKAACASLECHGGY